MHQDPQANGSPSSAYVPRILVVDDDKAVLAMAKAILEAVGHSVATAESGEVAVAMYRESLGSATAAPLVLLDLTLPGGMTGLETLDTLRSIDPAVKVIASSGYFDDSAAMFARQRGFFGILPKPYTAERLRKLVQWSANRAA